MRECELTSYVWFHHIATFIGVLTGCRLVGRKSMKPGSRCALLLFLSVQMWAVMKIIKDFRNGSSRLRECMNQLQRKSKNTYQARGKLVALLSVSALFKTGTPLLLNRAVRQVRQRRRTDEKI